MPPPSKRRRTETTTVEEVTFDLDARQDYLTGFHKRKLQRAKHGRDLAEKKARAERIEQRRRLRDERKEDLERHVAEVNALLKKAEPEEEAGSAGESNSEQEWDGVREPAELPEVDHEAEYIDEDRYTTVTIEAMDLSKEGLHKAEKEAEKEVGKDPNHSKEGNPEDPEAPPNHGQGKRIWTKEKPDKDGQASKKKRKKFRYENKAERKVTRFKEKSKNSKLAKARRSG